MIKFLEVNIEYHNIIIPTKEIYFYKKKGDIYYEHQGH